MGQLSGPVGRAPVRHLFVASSEPSGNGHLACKNLCFLSRKSQEEALWLRGHLRGTVEGWTIHVYSGAFAWQLSAGIDEGDQEAMASVHWKVVSG